jgi:hypothetical protein
MWGGGDSSTPIVLILRPFRQNSMHCLRSGAQVETQTEGVERGAGCEETSAPRNAKYSLCVRFMLSSRHGLASAFASGTNSTTLGSAWPSSIACRQTDMDHHMATQKKSLVGSEKGNRVQQTDHCTPGNLWRQMHRCQLKVPGKRSSARVLAAVLSKFNSLLFFLFY